MIACITRELTRERIKNFNASYGLFDMRYMGIQQPPTTIALKIVK